MIHYPPMLPSFGTKNGAGEKGGGVKWVKRRGRLDEDGGAT